MPHANTEALNAHLAAISSCIAEGSHAALLLDGAGWHVALNLVVPDNITLVHLPPYSPELVAAAALASEALAPRPH